MATAAKVLLSSCLRLESVDLVICVICGPGVCFLRHLLFAQVQSLRDRMLVAEDTRPITDAQIAVLREALNGNLRRTAIRSIGRIERADLIPLVAPALADGVGIRAEAANALAQMARTPAAVAEVQRLLIDRAAIDWKLETWESWGEIAAALGRLPYESAEQVSRAEAVLVHGAAGARFLYRDRDGRAGRRGSRSRVAVARVEEDRRARTAHVGPAAMGGDGTAAGRGSSVGAHSPPGDVGTDHRRAGDRVGDRSRAPRQRRRSPASWRSGGQR